MPNFDGNGPLKLGRVIGRGKGPCNKNTTGCSRKETGQKSHGDNGQPAE